MTEVILNNNNNQEKDPVPTPEEERDTLLKQQFLDTSQYSANGIARYEWVFGQTFLSTGGKETTDLLLGQVQLPSPTTHILDVGCGIGGHAFLLAERVAGAQVLGLDLSRNMLACAAQSLSQRPHLKSRVRFRLLDITKQQPDVPDGLFDLVYSRDCFMHIADKFALFRRLFAKLRPGGRILFTDYVSGQEAHADPEYAAYLTQRQYHPATVSKYHKVLTTSGFDQVRTADWTPVFQAALLRELRRLHDQRDQFLARFSHQDWQDLVDGWNRKLVRIDKGLQAWMWATAVKPMD